MSPPATCESNGWCLHNSPTQVKDFTNEDEIKSVYYEEIRQIVKDATGARRVLIFDHTFRASAAKGDSTLASPVNMVHCDYTANSAPNRFKQLGREGIYSHVQPQLND